MADRKCLYSDTIILINDARLNFLCIYFIALFIGLLKTIDPKINIYRIGFLNIVRHLTDAFWAKDP